MGYIEVRFTLEQWNTLNKTIEEQYHSYARIIADGCSSKRTEERFRADYKLWKSIEGAMISASEWSA